MPDGQGIKKPLVEAVGPLQQGLRLDTFRCPRSAVRAVEAVGPLQQGLRHKKKRWSGIAVLGRSSRSTTTGIATSDTNLATLFRRLVEAVGPLQQGLRPLILLPQRTASFLVEAVGPLQQGLRPLYLILLNSLVLSVEAVGPLQQGLRLIATDYLTGGGGGF